jgi:hypothetical protein
LLQVVKDVPLGYDFTLYSYGPFDSQVLTDLNTAESVGVLSSELEYYPSGYGYLISPSGSSTAARSVAADFIKRYKASITWVIENFSGRTASELELITTMVYVRRNHGALTKFELVRTVKEIKPHFSEIEIERKRTQLVEMGLLT